MCLSRLTCKMVVLHDRMICMIPGLVLTGLQDKASHPTEKTWTVFCHPHHAYHAYHAATCPKVA
jgi:hypothetical protein